MTSDQKPPASETVEERYARINGSRATTRREKPPSPATDSYLGVGDMFDLGGNPHATRNWSVPRYR